MVHPTFQVKGCRPRQGLPEPSPTALALPVPQIGSYYGSEITSVDIDGDGVTDVLLVGAPMYFSEGRERGRVYVYSLRQVLLGGGWQLPRDAWSLPSLWYPRGKLGHERGQCPPAEPGQRGREAPLSLGCCTRGGMLGEMGWRTDAAGPRGL